MANSGNQNPDPSSAATLLAADDVALRVASHGLTIRVSSLEHGMNDIKTQLSTLSQQISNQSANLTSQFQSYISNREREGRTPWGILISAAGFFLILIASVGGLAYAPILSAQNRLEVALGKLADNQIAMREFLIGNFVTQKDLDTRSERGKEDRDRTNRAIEKIQENVFPKAVHEQRWLRFDSDIAATNLRIDTLVQNLQREIDAIQKSQGDTFTARDALLENKERIGKLEDLVRQLAAGKGPP